MLVGFGGSWMPPTVERTYGGSRAPEKCGLQVDQSGSTSVIYFGISISASRPLGSYGTV